MPAPAPATRSGCTAHLAPDSHPAHALLSVANALLCPANTIAKPKPEKEPAVDLSVLPIEEVTMPADDVSDLRDVVDAINKLCETMKTSNYDEEAYEDCIVASEPDTMSYIYEPEIVETPQYTQYSECSTELISPEEVFVHKVEASRSERWSDSLISLPGQLEDVETITSDTEPAIAQFETMSEMYYTASSEVSLLSDLELPDKTHIEEDALPENRDSKEETNEKKECVIAGHVAAMRERFESMTRANTPCPDLVRSMSPSLDIFRNITPSPDRLG